MSMKIRRNKLAAKRLQRRIADYEKFIKEVTNKTAYTRPGSNKKG